MSGGAARGELQAEEAVGEEDKGGKCCQSGAGFLGLSRLLGLVLHFVSLFLAQK